MDTSSHHATIKIHYPQRTHTGGYKLVLENPLGSDSCEISVQVAGKINIIKQNELILNEKIRCYYNVIFIVQQLF